MDDDEVEDTQWTSAAKARYEECANGFVEAVRDHVQLTLAREGRQREDALYFTSLTRLAEAGSTFADAEFDWCGTFPLLSDDDDDDGEDEDEDETGGDNTVVSVLGRWDYRITAPDAVIDAGKQAYRTAWPQDTEEDARVRVDSVGRAVNEILHGGDLDALNAAPGLEPYQSSINVLIHDGRDDDEDIPHGLATSDD